MTALAANQRCRRWTDILTAPKEIDTTCRRIKQLLSGQGLESQGFEIELLARECLNNALSHGNQGDRQKHAYIGLTFGRCWIQLEVRDEGLGFPWRRIRSQAPSDLSSQGRGLQIIYCYAQHVRFNRSGNRVTLWLRRKPTK